MDPSSPGSREAISCQELLDRDWRPPPGEPQVAYDPSTGLATFELRDGPLVLDVKHDPACVRLPSYGAVIKQVLRDAEGFR